MTRIVALSEYWRSEASRRQLVLRVIEHECEGIMRLTHEFKRIFAPDYDECVNLKNSVNLGTQKLL